jgi:carbon-monoxide dehydrogenase medium subunit
LQAFAPAFVEAASKVGNPRVRAVATLGGALVHGDPRQDVPPVLLATRAELDIVSRRGSRHVALADFFLGFMETALEEDEILTKVTIPARPGWRDAYTRFTPGSDDDYPTVGVAVSVLIDETGVVRDAEIALGGVDASAIRVPEAAAAIIGTRAEADDRASAGRLAVDGCSPSDDQRGSEAYKRAMVEVWTDRTIAACLS